MNDQQDKQSIFNDSSQSSSDNEGTKDFKTCAVWAEGYIEWWDHEKNRWKRSGETSWDGYEVACLKSLKHFTKEFFQEIKNQLKFRKSNNAIEIYGITKNENEIRGPVPDLLLDLIHRCLDKNLESRPSSSKLAKTLQRYYVDVNLENVESEIYRQVISIEEDTARSQQDHSIDFSQLNSDTHSTAVYTSRLLLESKQMELHITDTISFTSE
ncbi:12820_t:CDS:2 [Acaulospora morrowiae]|uniref:12820_t:CDS:1 n=1 Tax=Acaulospora morrowiae TaxID=94023 RepID=A0A9N9BW96_9GLOM|nr:12820_t:CDS:2 [Acaulospora morrowiae]